ncbi:MAG: hypothetical protein VX438_17390, partial [Planctomycetota bacterium]|nr:hypothetical protein [Planctomycetota bacterium]
DDEETKWRIEKIKEHLKEATGPANSESTFDVLILKDEAIQLDGELELGNLTALYGNSTISITRDQIVTITDEPLQKNFALANSTGVGKREQDYPDANGTMPAGMNYISFEQFPNGKEMEANIDVSRAFVARGLLFKTSFPESYVGTQMYTFTNGRGGNYSIANVEPTYQGVITISFCVPGNQMFAAGTRYVGFNVSHVNPGGTDFEAYDAQGQLITKFTTDASGTDYLGFKSEIPIAKVVVRPNIEIDEDFAIDDLFFENPVALLESGNPRFFSVVTNKGERLQAKTISVEKNTVTLEDLSFGTKSISVSLDDVWVLIGNPSSSEPSSPPMAEATMKNHCYCLTDQGSIVLADLGNQKSIRFNKKLDIETVVAIWGLDQQMATPPISKIEKGTAAVFAKGQYFIFSDVKFDKQWIRSSSVQKLASEQPPGTGENPDEVPSVDLSDSRYRNSPCVYFKSPGKIEKQAGVIYTVNGERYFLGESYGTAKVNSQGVLLSQGAESTLLSWQEIKSLRFPKK